MRIVLCGGTGQVGEMLRRAFVGDGHDVVVLSRRPADPPARLQGDGETLGDWAAAVDGADVVINLAGRTVNCRYTPENLRQMMDSRVNSTRVVGLAIVAAARPPPVWLQMSTATIYAHRFDAPNDEATGIIGGDEPDVPAYWQRSIAIAQAWEATLAAADTPHTRKVALRTAMVMSPAPDGVFDVLSGMVRWGLGGPIGGGRQAVSWIHEHDLVAALRFLMDRDDIDGAVNLAAPGPLPQRAFMAELRAAWGVSIGLPATAWMAEIGAFFLRTDTELLLKSRNVIPGRLLEHGFVFEHAEWSSAAAELVGRSRS
jgi:uncharacterized protein (TIGR01777 family)